MELEVFHHPEMNQRAALPQVTLSLVPQMNKKRKGKKLSLEPEGVRKRRWLEEMAPLWRNFSQQQKDIIEVYGWYFVDSLQKSPTKVCDFLLYFYAVIIDAENFWSPQTKHPSCATTLCSSHCFLCERNC